MQLTPGDAHDERLLAQVHPPDWVNPLPSGRYNLVAIGGGTAGLVAAVGAAGLGAKVALIERHLLGGDCLNFGCVPSKALIRSARVARDMTAAVTYGFRGTINGRFDFAAVMERVRSLRTEISHHDSAARLKQLGVDVFLGQASFTGRKCLSVAGQKLEFSRAVIATGTRPLEPPVEGLCQLGYLTNETVFELTELPRTLIVLGGGPIGCELAQAFRRLGSEVHLIDHRPRILPKEDPQAAEAIQKRLESEGVHLYLGCRASSAKQLGPSKSLVIQQGDEKQVLIGDQILVAIGRRPAVEGLELAAAGIEANERGVVVNDFLQTTNRRVYAAGDVCTDVRFTHAADAMSRIVLQNALFFGRKRFSRVHIPRTTFTEPEIAQVGLTAAEAQVRGIAVDTYRANLTDVDRAVVDGETEGFAVVHTRKGSGCIVGGTIIAPQAGEMIGELTMLLNQKQSLSRLANTVHCYPTQVEVLKHIADQYQRTRLTPRVARLFEKLLAWRR